MFDKLVQSFLVLCVVVLIVILCGVFYKEITSESITLNRSDWYCVKYENKVIHSTMLVGKVIIPSQYTTNVCVEYKMNKGE